MSNRAPSSSSTKPPVDYPGYDWGTGSSSDQTNNNNTPQPLHPLEKNKLQQQQQQQQLSSSSSSSSKYDSSSSLSYQQQIQHAQLAQQQQQQQKNNQKSIDSLINPQTGKLRVEKDQEISLVNVPIRTMATYTLVRNPMLGVSVYGMLAGYGALFHSLLSRAPAKNTFYWGNVCVAWKVALIATVYFRGIESEGKPGTLYKEYVKVEEF